MPSVILAWPWRVVSMPRVILPGLLEGGLYAQHDSRSAVEGGLYAQHDSRRAVEGGLYAQCESRRAVEGGLYAQCDSRRVVEGGLYAQRVLWPRVMHTGGSGKKPARGRRFRQPAPSLVFALCRLGCQEEFREARP